MQSINKLILVLFAISISLQLMAQEDAEARKILDAVSQKNKSYETIRAKFTYQAVNQQNDVKEEYEGVIYLKGDKYKLFFMNNEIIFNGKYLTTLNLELKEATISTQSPDDENSINPADLFTIYDKDFKFRYMGDETVNSVAYQLIELLPIDRKNKRYSKIKLWVEQSTQHIYSMMYIGKNGVNILIRINELKPNVKIVDKLFEFDATKHPDVEVVDMR